MAIAIMTSSPNLPVPSPSCILRAALPLIDVVLQPSPNVKAANLFLSISHEALPLIKMSELQPVTNPASISARSRRSSVSAIPRPVSGTSRIATPTISRAGTRDSPAGIAPLKTTHKHRKSRHPNSGLAPSSFRLPRHELPRPADYTVPYKQRPEQDLSGTRQQLDIRNMSTHSLVVPDVNTAPRPLKQASSANALPDQRR